MQEPGTNPGQCSGRDFGVLSPKREIFMKDPCGPRDLCIRGSGKLFRTREVEASKEGGPFRHNRTDEQMNSEKMAALGPN